MCIWMDAFYLRKQAFAICHLPFAICHLPFVICHLALAITFSFGICWFWFGFSVLFGFGAGTYCIAMVFGGRKALIFGNCAANSSSTGLFDVVCVVGGRSMPV